MEGRTLWASPLLCMLLVWVTACSVGKARMEPKANDPHITGCLATLYYLTDTSCPRTSIKFITKSKIILCQTYEGINMVSFTASSHHKAFEGRRYNNTAEQFRVTRTRLLISKPTVKSQTHLRQLNLNTSSFSTYYPCLISCQVRALLYLSIRRTVLIAIPNRKIMKACALDDGKLSTLKLRLRVKDMDVDESRQLVFMNIIGQGVTIYRMTTTGANFTQVINTKKYKSATDIVVDEKRKNLYISILTKVMISVSYEGNNMHTIVKNLIKVNTMTLEPNQDVLYYINDKMISVFSLQTNVSRYVSRLPKSNFDMVHYGNKLYISIWDSLVTFDLKSNETKEMSTRIAYICLVP